MARPYELLQRRAVDGRLCRDRSWHGNDVNLLRKFSEWRLNRCMQPRVYPTELGPSDLAPLPSMQGRGDLVVRWSTTQTAPVRSVYGHTVEDE